MLMTDKQIHSAILGNEISVKPFVPEHLQPVSLDLTLGSEVQYLTRRAAVLDVTDVPNMVRGQIGECGWVLGPGDFILAHTRERFRFPPYIAGRIDGKSSLGRLGLMVHVTAGLVDPGFRGDLVLEVCNVGPVSLRLREGMRIAQLSFDWLAHSVDRPYGSEALGSKYQDQRGAQGSLFYQNYPE